MTKAKKSYCSICKSEITHGIEINRFCSKKCHRQWINTVGSDQSKDGGYDLVFNYERYKLSQSKYQ